MKQYVEIVVDIPLRRTFGKQTSPPSAQSIENPWVDSAEQAKASYRIFHYHVPIELEDKIAPGHLVWVPFSSREIQGIVLRLTDHAPVPTKAVLRLARPHPVLTRTQIDLAYWIADYYMASLTEAVKLFLPPGLLGKAEGRIGVRVKRERHIELALPFQEALARLDRLAPRTPQIAVLSWFAEEPGLAVSAADVATACGLKSNSTVETLLRKGCLQRDAEGLLTLRMTLQEVLQELDEQKGLGKYRTVLRALHQANRPLWQSELYSLVETDLATLRKLRQAGLIHMVEQIRFRDPLAGRVFPRTQPPALTSEQAAVWSQIQTRLENAAPEQPSIFLLHGVTGSGKTEIYLHALATALDLGRQAIVLVPEIALTAQTVARFAGRFPGRVTVIHSGLSVGERYDVWRAVRDGEYDVVVGPRSALFAPLPRLGLIVVDEEHETSYKQSAEEWGSLTVFYDARVVAQQLAVLTNSLVIMGSATPSLEAYHAARQNEIQLLELPQRVLGHEPPDAQHPMGVTLYAELPPVEIVDLRQELRAGNRSIFSRALQAEIHATLDAGQQAMLFLNRRGSASFVICRDCGYVQECNRCDTPLTFHDRAQMLVCHHCNRRYPIPDTCPECQSKRIKYFGSGTQRIEELVAEIEPRARVLRWDADTTTRRGSHEEILSRFAAHEADILVGTQMIAKGLDLPLVTLVGVIAADMPLYLPDFRSAERTFQLLTQVAGRAGRSANGGRVVIQTYSPEHYAIQAAAAHDYHAFYLREMEFRREHGYPPLHRLTRLIYWHKQRQAVEKEAQRMTDRLRQRVASMGVQGAGIEIAGPAPAFFARYRGYYRWQILVRAPEIAALLSEVDIPYGWRIDVDPVSVL